MRLIIQNRATDILYVIISSLFYSYFCSTPLKVKMYCLCFICLLLCTFVVKNMSSVKEIWWNYQTVHKTIKSAPNAGSNSIKSSVLPHERRYCWILNYIMLIFMCLCWIISFYYFHMEDVSSFSHRELVKWSRSYSCTFKSTFKGNMIAVQLFMSSPPLNSIPTLIERRKASSLNSSDCGVFVVPPSG